MNLTNTSDLNVSSIPPSALKAHTWLSAKCGQAEPEKKGGACEKIYS